MSVAARVPGRTLGEGPSELLANLDLMCPFSRRALPVLEALAARHDGRLRVRVLVWAQPWHPQTSYLARAALAAGQLGGDKAFFAALRLLYAAQEDLADDKVEDITPRQLYARLEELVADALPADKRAQFQECVRGAEVTTELKLHQKYGRQNGLHVSPTYMANGVEINGSSGWDADKWTEVLAAAL